MIELMNRCTPNIVRNRKRSQHNPSSVSLHDWYGNSSALYQLYVNNVTEITNQRTFPTINSADKSVDQQFAYKPRVRRTLRGHYGKVYTLHWATSEPGVPETSYPNTIVSASQDGKLIIWDAIKAAKKKVIPMHSSWVMTCAFEPSKGAAVACGGLDNCCSVYSLTSDVVQSSSSTAELVGHDGYVSCCRFLEESQILTSSGDATCILWDVESEDQISRFRGHESDVMSFSPSPTEPNIFVTGSCDANACVFDKRVAAPVQTFGETMDAHESDINAVKFLRNGTAFVTGSDDCTCRLFDLRAYSELSCFSEPSIICGVTSVDVSRSGRVLFAGYDNSDCIAWDMLYWNKNGTIRLGAHENKVSCLEVDPSGAALCTGSWDALLRVWC